MPLWKLRTAQWILVGVFAIACVMKVASASQFKIVVDYLAPIEFSGPRTLAALVAALVAVEGALATLWVVRPLSILTAAATIAVLIALSLALVALALGQGAPGCGCLSGAPAVAHARADAFIGLARNMGLIGLAVWIIGNRAEAAAALCSTPRSMTPGDPRRRDDSRGPGASIGPAAPTRAFTVVELLLVIAIIAVLLTFAVPALRSARDGATRTSTLVTTGQVGMATLTYANDYAGVFPYLAQPGNPGAGVRIGAWSTQQSLAAAFRATSLFWMSILVPSYFDRRDAEIDIDFERPSIDTADYPPRVFRTSFYLTHGTIAASNYWIADEVPEDLNLFRPGSAHDIRSPSKKILVLDIRDMGDDPNFFWRHAARADGSAAFLKLPAEDAAIAPFVVPHRPFGALPWVGLSTRGGLAGRDE